MRMLDKARLRLRSLCRRPNVEFELEAELRFHLDQLIEENISSGMPPEEAQRHFILVSMACWTSRMGESGPTSQRPGGAPTVAR